MARKGLSVKNVTIHVRLQRTSRDMWWHILAKSHLSVKNVIIPLLLQEMWRSICRDANTWECDKKCNAKNKFNNIWNILPLLGFIEWYCNSLSTTAKKYERDLIYLWTSMILGLSPTQWKRLTNEPIGKQGGWGSQLWQTRAAWEPGWLAGYYS